MIDYSLILTVKYPNKKWSLNGFEYSGLDWKDESPKPTKEELDSKWEEVLIIQKKENCKNQAKILISDCDWSVLLDVNLINKQDFINYRSALRVLILHPVENPVWPEEPDPVWA